MTLINKTCSIAIALLTPLSSHAVDLWSSSVSNLTPSGQFTRAIYDYSLNEAVISQLNVGDIINLPLADGDLSLKLQFIETHGETIVLSGILSEENGSSFYMRVQNGVVSGIFYENDAEFGFRFDHSNNRIYEMQIDQIMCLNYGNSDQVNETNQEVQQIEPSKNLVQSRSSSVPALQSLPGSEYVLYIDFDGETVNGYWADSENNGNPIVAAAFDLDGDSNTYNAEEMEYIETVWKAVSEDYSIFDVNVTTNRAVYDLASEHQRAQNIVTPSCEWLACSNSIYGIAAYPQFGAFENCLTCGDYSPSWVFPFTGNGNLRRNAFGVAQDVSHEFGHGFWLAHDGFILSNGNTFPYYGGNSEWAPIMGFSGSADKLITFSKGEYPNAYEDQDDIETINQIHLNFRFDQNESSSGEGTHHGIIGSFDTDEYSFFAKPTDTINLIANGSGSGITNLDIRLQLFSPSDSLVVDANPTSSLNASLTHAPTEIGNYRAVVSGVGSSNADSYTRYGSIGQYTINIARTVVNPDPSNTIIVPTIMLLLLDDEDLAQ